ncbi:hypothetical protein BVY00_00700 [bacterium G20]|nr:hypothetical protein BVY00_00700 [bacterium G20]
MLAGLKIIKTIQTTDRFDAYGAELNDQKVFAKKAKGEKPRELLARVPENSVVANRMGQKTAFKFRVPEVYKHDGDWLVTEWIEGEPLGNKIDGQLERVAEILANFLIVFDSEPVINGEVRKTFKSDNLAAYMEEKLPKNLSPERNKVLADAKRLFDKLQPVLATAWQDGDIRPDHLFFDPKNKDGFVLVDPEHLDPRWPRFYSLANNFAKYWVRGPQEFSKDLVRLFMNKSGVSEETIFCPLLANIIVRGISLHWEADYDPGAESYNIPRAQAMLKTCITAGNLEDLSST